MVSAIGVSLPSGSVHACGPSRTQLLPDSLYDHLAGRTTCGPSRPWAAEPLGLDRPAFSGLQSGAGMGCCVNRGMVQYLAVADGKDGGRAGPDALAR
jgi:hypothetical protein